MRIGILGGSFDPIHKGHLVLARESMKQFKLDKVLFTPASTPPQKKDTILTPAPFRARMVELALMDEPCWELCDLELKRPGISYTVDTLRELRKIYPPPHELFFIAGADSLLDLPHWKEPEEILQLAEWIVAPRSPGAFSKPLPPRVHPLRISPVEISATELRERIHRDEDSSQWLPLYVWDYIRRMELYGRREP